jgi:hypothetical protein
MPEFSLNVGVPERKRNGSLAARHRMETAICASFGNIRRSIPPRLPFATAQLLLSLNRVQRMPALLHRPKLTGRLSLQFEMFDI